MARAICMKHRCFCFSIISSSLILGGNAAIVLYWPKFPQKRESNPWRWHERLCHIFLLISVTLVKSGCWWNLDSSPHHCPEPWALTLILHCGAAIANRAQDQLQNSPLENQWLTRMNSHLPSSHIPSSAFSTPLRNEGGVIHPYSALLVCPCHSKGISVLYSPAFRDVKSYFSWSCHCYNIEPGTGLDIAFPRCTSCC